MAFNEIIDAIYARAETVLAAYEGTRDNAAGFDKPDDALWYRLSVRPAASETIAISTKNAINGIQQIGT